MVEVISREEEEKEEEGFICSTELREEEEEGSSNSKWSLLVGDVLESICEHLSFCDYLAVRAVCSNWRAIAKAMHYLPSHKVPLLLYVDKYNRRFCFYNLSKSTSRLFYLKWPTIFLNSDHNFCHGTVQGWMIMTEFNLSLSQTYVFFYNPITHAIVKLPSSLPQINPTTQIFKIVSSSPHNDPNCVLVCLYSDHCNFAFSKINDSDDSSWSLVKGDKESGINFMEVEIHKGKLYAITDSKLNSLLVYDLQQQPVLKPIILAKLPYNDISYSACGNKFQHLAIDTSSGALLLVLRNMVRYKYETTSKCQVFKLRMINDSKAVRWTQVDDLGDGLLFVGEYNSLVISQSAFDHVCPPWFPRHDWDTDNSVFIGDSRFRPNFWGRSPDWSPGMWSWGAMTFYLYIYYLTDQSFNRRLLSISLNGFQDLSPPVILPPPIWFTPRV